MGWKRETCLSIGSCLPARAVSGGLAIAEALEMGHWLRASGYKRQSIAPNREALFEKIAREVEHRIVLYLEFGVWQGASIAKWSTLLKNPESMLHGFDSFIGLPQDWMQGIQKGHFSTKGKCPDCTDPRVKFFKGLFHETLPHYVIPPHDVLVISIDCDLYLAARYVLDFLEPHLRPGDFMYFDEFHIPHDEVRAFREFSRNTGRVFSLFGATEGFAGVVFRCGESPQIVGSATPGIQI